MGQLDCAQCWVERREQHVGGEHAGLAETIEQSRFTSVGVAHERHDRIRHALAAVAVELARALDLAEFHLDARDALFDHAPIGLDLRLTGPAEKAEAAALAFEMCPGAHEPALLVGQMRELDLYRPFPGAGPPAKDYEATSGAIGHLASPR